MAASLLGSLIYSNELQNKLESKEQQVATLANEYGSLKKDLAEATATITEISAKQKKTEEESSKTKTELNKLQKQMVEKEKIIKTQEGTIDSLGEQLAAEEQIDLEIEAQKAAEQKKKEQERAEESAQKNALSRKNVEPETPSGEVLYMEATAYSSDPADVLGGGSVTATGQNLLANPMAVSVDPSVIPLGSLLHVEGYGQAYACDTGGAIRGNIIDIHFPSNSQCIAWGRRQVKVTILKWG